MFRGLVRNARLCKAGSTLALIFAILVGAVGAQVASAAVAVQIDTGSGHTCAVLSNRAVRCWGANDYGQLGDRTASPRTRPVSVIGVTNAVRVAAGDAASCAVLVTGAISCWGANDTGVLGNGTTSDSLVPVNVSGISTATQVAIGDGFACAIVGGGAIKCWGTNDSGQLGNGTYVRSTAPVSVTGVTGATQLALGSSHACAVLGTGTVKCWGANDMGQLGNGKWLTSPTPVLAYSLTGALKIATGTSHTCVVVSGGSIYCWGRDDVYQLGNQTQDPAGFSVPMKALGISTATEVAAGDGHTCVRLSSGAVNCFGGDYFGQLGDGTTEHDFGTPIAAKGLSGAVAVTATGDHSCALKALGQVMCWGDNGDGVLGDGTTTYRSAPVSVLSLSTAPATPQVSVKPAPFANTKAASFTFAAEVGNSTSCQLDSSAWQACSSPKSYSNLAEGAHRFAVRAADPGGTFSASSLVSWTIDTIAPVITGKVTIAAAGSATALSSTCSTSAGLPTTLEWSTSPSSPAASAAPVGARVIPWATRVTVAGRQAITWVRVADAANNRSAWVKVG